MRQQRLRCQTRIRAVCRIRCSNGMPGAKKPGRMEVKMDNINLLVGIDAESIKENVIFGIMNTEWNKDVLEFLVHRELLDLSIYYRIVVDRGNGNLDTVNVTQFIANFFKLTEAQLFDLATENTKRLCPIETFSTAKYFLRREMQEHGLPEEEIEAAVSEITPDMDMWCMYVRNETDADVFFTGHPLDGAYALILTDHLKALAEEIHADLYLLPSSVNEILVTKVGGECPLETLSCLVPNVNQGGSLAPDQVLSNHVYLFTRETGEITFAQTAKAEDLLSYEDFKTKVMNDFLDYMPEDLQHLEVRSHVVVKNNVTREVICLVNPQASCSESYDARLQDMYEDYCSGVSFEEVVRDAVSVIVESVKNPPEIPDLMDPSMLENVVFSLANADTNRALAEQMVHRKVMNLLVYYRWEVECGTMQGSIPVSKKFAEVRGLSEQDLYDLAVKNTKRLCPLKAFPLISMIDERDLGVMGHPGNDPDGVWVVRVEPKGESCQGQAAVRDEAYALLFPEVLEELAEKVQGDLYVLAASNDSVLAVAAEATNPLSLKAIIMDSFSKLPLEMRLSDKLYYYRHDTKELLCEADCG